MQSVLECLGTVECLLTGVNVFLYGGKIDEAAQKECIEVLMSKARKNLINAMNMCELLIRSGVGDDENQRTV